MSWLARWGWLAVPTTWTKCFSTFTNIKDDVLPQKIVFFFLRQKEFNKLARKEGLVSRPHHLETVFFNLYKYKRRRFTTKNCLFSLRQKEFYELARQVGLVSCPHHLVDTLFFNLYLVENKYKRRHFATKNFLFSL
jgi:hypothetical protein